MSIKSFKSRSILFIDSGIGGLSTLAKTSKILKANYIYFADNNYAPYGTKSDEFLNKRLSQIVSSMLNKHNISLVVLACNTATTSSIEHLRKTFPFLTFVGTEPACKIATDKNFQKPAVIATNQTINHLKTRLSSDFKLISCPMLATSVENRLLTPSPRAKFDLIKQIYFIKNQIKENDCLVLGCTHYSLIYQNFLNKLNIPIFDGNNGVAHQILKQYNQKQANFSTFKIILSSKNSTSLQKYKKILKQILANQINLC